MSGGTLSFDLKILSEPDGTAWNLIVDCSYPCNSGDVPLSANVEGTQPVIGEWQSYTFNVDDLVNREGSSLDLSRVHLPALIMPSWTNQTGAAYLLDNVVYTAAE